MIRRPPRFKRTDTLFPYTTLFRSGFRLRLGRFFGLPISRGVSFLPPPLVRHRRASPAIIESFPCLFPHSASPNLSFARPRPRAMIRPRRSSRSEEHTSELQSLMRISYAVFCLNKHIYSKTTLNVQ